MGPGGPCEPVRVWFQVTQSTHTSVLFPTSMSAHGNEDLIKYKDEHEVIPGGIAASATNGAVDGDDKDKKKFSGIHSTGFRCLMHCALVSASAEHAFFPMKGLLTQT